MEFTNFEEWTAACDKCGYAGPFQIQGYRSFEYRNPETVAIWNDDKGSIFGPIPDDTAEAMEE